jgi:phospholipid/cholesterol/gamma-HCH transport system substrate-binding protein
MEREANYAAVGAFVLIVALIGALFVYWYSDSREHRSYDRYEIYFEGSVSGLERGAAVRYLGVGVGRVVTMNVDPRDPSRVRVVVDIDSSTPISDRTVAQLSLQGVTGLLFIDLQQDRSRKPPVAAVPSYKYPVIRSVPSQFDVFLASLPELVAKATDVVQRVGRLMSDQNLAAVSSSLGNLRTASTGLPQTLQELSSLITDLRGTARELTDSARSTRKMVDELGPDAVGTVKRLQTVADNLAKASAEIDRIVAENRQDIRSFTRDGLPEIERFVREGRAAAQDIRALSNSLRENPSQLLYQPSDRGVEIPR